MLAWQEFMKNKSKLFGHAVKGYFWKVEVIGEDGYNTIFGIQLILLVEDLYVQQNKKSLYERLRVSWENAGESKLSNREGIGRRYLVFIFEGDGFCYGPYKKNNKEHKSRLNALIYYFSVIDSLLPLEHISDGKAEGIKRVYEKSARTFGRGNFHIRKGK